MTPLEKLRARMQALTAEGRTLAAKDEPTDEEVGRMKAIQADLVAAEERQKALTDFSATLERMQSDDPIPATAGPAAGEPAGGYAIPRHRGRLQMFRGQQAGEQPPDVRAYRTGQFLLASLFGLPKSRQFCRDHGIPLIFETDVGDRRFAVAGASEAINTDGGFLVPEEMENAVLDYLEVYGLARRECEPVPMARDTKVQPNKTGRLTFYPVGEGVAGTVSQMAFGQIGLTARKWMCIAPYSSEIDEDSVISFADEVTRDAGEAAAATEDDCLINAAGLSAHHGINGIRNRLTAAAGLAGAIAAATAAHDTFAELDATDLQQAMSLHPNRAYNGAKWFCSQYAFGAAFQRLIAAAGGNTVANLVAGVPKQYLGYPIEITEAMPSGVATDYTGLAMILFGNMRMAAKFGSRRGMTIQLLKELYAASDQIALKFTERFDINVHGLGTTAATGTLTAVVGGSG